MSEAKYWEEREAAKAKALKLAAKAEVELSEEERIAARMAEEVARMEKAIEGMSPDEVYGYCRKLEDDRIRKHFSTDTGKLENEMLLSLDQLVDSFEDPSKIQVFSDRGKGKASIRASERAEAVSFALNLLAPEDKAFAQGILDGKSWREMGIERYKYYRLLKKVEKIFKQSATHPPKTFP